MTKEGLDPRKQMLVAALYGEFSAEEEAEFEAMLATDKTLRAEFEELGGTRAFLGEWEFSDPVPSFVFMDQELEAGSKKGFWPLLAARFQTPIPTWGFAAATVAMAALILTGFRVDWVDNGIAFRFGSPPPVTIPQDLAGTNPTPLGVAAGPHSGIRAEPVKQQGIPVTRQDLSLYSGGIMQAMSTMLDDYQTERNAELAYILKAFYEEIRLNRQREYAELRTQMEGMGMGLMAEQTMTNRALNSLIQRGEGNPVPLNPYRETPLNPNKDKQND
jgi:hypothetical protein